MDFYTNLKFEVQKGRGLGSRDQNLKFWDPLITFERTKLSASDLVQTEVGPSCVRTIKPLSGRGQGHVTQFWDPVITFERIVLSASNSVYN